MTIQEQLLAAAIRHGAAADKRIEQLTQANAKLVKDLADVRARLDLQTTPPNRVSTYYGPNKNGQTKI